LSVCGWGGHCAGASDDGRECNVWMYEQRWSSRIQLLSGGMSRENNVAAWTLAQVDEDVEMNSLYSVDLVYNII
jgi:hypothetical protein